jgi:hypothetical protein
VLEALGADERDAALLALEQRALVRVQRADRYAQNEIACVARAVAERTQAAVQVEHLAAQLGRPRALGAAGAVQRGRAAALVVGALLGVAQCVVALAQERGHRTGRERRDRRGDRDPDQCGRDSGAELMAISAEQDGAQRPCGDAGDDPCRAVEEHPASCRPLWHACAIPEWARRHSPVCGVTP